METTWIFGTVFSALTLYGFWRWRRVSRMARWARTQAIISKLEVEAIKGSQKGIPYVRYVSRLEYRYVVEAAAYVSKRFSVDNFLVGNSADELKRLLGGASAGDSIDVFYDPHKPSNAVLILPGRSGVLLTTFIGLFGLSLVVILNLAH